MSILILLLVSLAVVSGRLACHFIPRNTASFVLNGSQVDPDLIRYEEAGIPFNLQWKIVSTPYDVISKANHNLSLKENEKINVIDTSSLVAGDYSFSLFTSNLQDMTVKCNHFKLSIIIDTVKTETPRFIHSHEFNILVLEKVLLIADCVMVIMYKFIEMIFDLTRALFVTMQYVKDHVLSYETLISPKNLAFYKHIDIETAHYFYNRGGNTQMTKSEQTQHFRQQQFTLRDYFERNGVAPHYYDVVRAVFEVINDFSEKKYRL